MCHLCVERTCAYLCQRFRKDMYIFVSTAFRKDVYIFISMCKKDMYRDDLDM